MRPFSFEEHFDVEDIASDIGSRWEELDGMRVRWKDEVTELRHYIFATDTRTTQNQQASWKNSTTVPQLTAIRDRLQAHAMNMLFPNEEWFEWVARDREAANRALTATITAYMRAKLDTFDFMHIAGQMVDDVMDYGVCFGEAEFVRQVKEGLNGNQIVFEGPVARRISPLDVVFDPTVQSFYDSPTIKRVVTTLPEILVKAEDDPGLGYDVSVVNKLLEKKQSARDYAGVDQRKVDGFRLDGFGDFHQYLNSDRAELLEFKGDYYDRWNGKLYRDQIITVLDRTYVLRNITSESYMRKTIFMGGWRARQDNLWSMGPLANLTGMQYRIDHMENAKADAVDDYVHPKKIFKGYVEHFEDGPGAEIFVGDDGDVQFVRPDLGFLQYDQEMANYMRIMETMAGAPPDLAGIRTPGNKTLFEVESLNNNAQVLFSHRIRLLERNFFEPLLNSMLDIGVRRMGAQDVVPVPNEQLGSTDFLTLTPEMLSGNGSIRPIGARRFAARSRLLQDLSNFSNTSIGQDPSVRAHWSGLGIAKLIEEILGVQKYNIVRENVGVLEQAETQKLANAAAQEAAIESSTPTELTDEDIILEGT